MNRRGLSWLLEVHVDRRWYELRRSPETIPAPGRPRMIPLDAQTLGEQPIVLGRGQAGHDVDVDLRPDNGVSRRHASLEHADGHWWVTDLESHNGTWLSDDLGRLPTRRVTTRTRLVDGTNLFLGSWTRLALRRDPGASDELPGGATRGWRR